MTDRPLDLDAVRAFVRITELGSFTRAAQSMQATQSAVSLKLKRLEDRLDCRLIERTPRQVRLSAEGAAFLDHARALLGAHDSAVHALCTTRQRLTVGISDYVAGPELSLLIARLTAQDPQLLIDIRIASSKDLLQRFDQREFDAVVVRQNSGRDDGVVIAEERFGWFAAPDWRPRNDEPLPVITMPKPCGVRLIAAQSLEQAGIPWIEAFVGGGIAAVSAAVMAGLGVSAMSRRLLPLGAVDVTERLGLPQLPRFPIVIHARGGNDPARKALDALSLSLKSAIRD